MVGNLINGIFLWRKLLVGRLWGISSTKNMVMWNQETERTGKTGLSFGNDHFPRQEKHRIYLKDIIIIFNRGNLLPTLGKVFGLKNESMYLHWQSVARCCNNFLVFCSKFWVMDWGYFTRIHHICNCSLSEISCSFFYCLVKPEGEYKQGILKILKFFCILTLKNTYSLELEIEISLFSSIYSCLFRQGQHRYFN